MISKHKIQANIKKISAFGVIVFAAMLFSFSPFLSGSAEAGGKPDGQGNVVGSLCYLGGTINRVQLLSTDSTRQACIGEGGQIIEPGQPVPVVLCATNTAAQQITDNTEGARQACRNVGGNVIEPGQPLPTLLVPDPATQPGDPTQYTAPITIDGQVRTSGKLCGEGTEAINPVIDLGCKGIGNPILDLVFAIVRFLTLGAGLVMIGSTIVAGIQYTTSRGDPQATAAALKRITSTVSALLFFIFAYAILNWIVPAGILK